MIQRIPASGAVERATRAQRVLLGLCGAALCGAAAGAQAPRAVSATYNLYVNGAHVAVMNESYDAKDSSYRIVSESVPLGVLALVQIPRCAHYPTDVGAGLALGVASEKAVDLAEELAFE